jgi:hypothetical protein
MIFRRLLKDLQDLEINGIEISGVVVKGTVVAITGDNLGSHGIGGFNENFSTSDFICRYCDCIRAEWSTDGCAQGKFRSKSDYDAAVDILCQNSQYSEYAGIKSKSIFNYLQHFHVCQPGLPPCLAHDLFEGVVAYDMALMIHYFVRTAKWFSYDLLNSRIQQFPYEGQDARSKPCELPVSGVRLGGQAAQNWSLLRLFGMIVYGLVKDVNDPVWSLYLNLCDLVALVCAPRIEMGQLSLMKTLIEDYLECRLRLFPEKGLRPKHHYLIHYPILCLQFGPLIHMWTMRFESKHSYFKRAIRNLHNFVNLTKTLANRHQLLQCYQMAGHILSSDVDSVGNMTYNEHVYSVGIQKAVEQIKSSNADLEVCSQLSVHGTTYKVGLFVMLTYAGYQCDAVFGKIVLLILHTGRKPFFVLKPFAGAWSSEVSTYSVTELSPSTFQCVAHSDLLDYYPLVSYGRNNKTYVVLKHTCVLASSGCQQQI